MAATINMDTPPARTTHPNDYVLGRCGSPRAHLSAKARIAPPGYAGFKPSNTRGKHSAPPSSRSEDTCSMVSDLGSQPGSPGKPISTKVWRAPPGYSGYMPGKNTGGTVGKIFHTANKTATQELRRPAAPEVPLKTEQFHARQQVPGYSGFMPGKKADNLIGRSAMSAAKNGWLQQERADALGGGIVRVSQ